MSISLPARLSGYGVHPVLLVSMENNQMISYRDVTFVLPANTIKGSWSEHGLINQLAVALGFTGEHSLDKLDKYTDALKALGVQKVTVNDNGSATYTCSGTKEAFPSTELNKLLKDQTNPNRMLNIIYDDLINEILEMPAKTLHEAVQRMIKWMEEDHQKTLAFLKQLAKSLAKKTVEKKMQEQLKEANRLFQLLLAVALLKSIDPSFTASCFVVEDTINKINFKTKKLNSAELTGLIKDLLDPRFSFNDSFEVHFDQVLNNTRTQYALYNRYQLQRLGIK